MSVFDETLEANDIAEVLAFYRCTGVPKMNDLVAFLKQNQLDHVTPARAMWYLQLQHQDDEMPGMSSVMEYLRTDRAPDEDEVKAAMNDVRALFSEPFDKRMLQEVMAEAEAEGLPVDPRDLDEDVQELNERIFKELDGMSVDDVQRAWEVYRVNGFPPFKAPAAQMHLH